MADSQNMTVISMITQKGGGSEKRVLTVQIDGQSGFYLSFGAERYATKI